MTKEEYQKVLSQVDFNYGYYNGELHKKEKAKFDSAKYQSKTSKDFEGMFNDARRGAK